MKNIQELIDDVMDEVDEIVGEYKAYPAEKCGLDSRCGVILISPDEDFIAVRKSDDRRLQYYGGFEYVEEECRYVLGDYVFYSEDDRVEEAIKTATE